MYVNVEMFLFDHRIQYGQSLNANFLHQKIRLCCINDNIVKND